MNKVKVKTFDGATRIAMERERQISKEGYTFGHDDEHFNGEMVGAALYYLGEGKVYYHHIGSGTHLFKESWPEDWALPKVPPSRIRALEIAGALIAAEIDRLLRAEGKDHTTLKRTGGGPLFTEAEVERSIEFGAGKAQEHDAQQHLTFEARIGFGVRRAIESLVVTFTSRDLNPKCTPGCPGTKEKPCPYSDAGTTDQCAGDGKLRPVEFDQTAIWALAKNLSDEHESVMEETRSWATLPMSEKYHWHRQATYLARQLARALQKEPDEPSKKENP